ncbi:MAG: histidine--tRNA ligase [Candidatus Omnitrophica bacterium]|jgi:histidyl-tRNA synthetase|nr:histidine--tRNA ligase [Candidatus Omnitrophota bacterium]
MSANKINRLKGTQDIMSQEACLWQEIEDTARDTALVYGYRPIRTPIIEQTCLFARSSGEESDIVKKQIYSFSDQGKREICLRPEATASVCRAYIENCLDKTEGFVKFFYSGPMFRSERPQAGRFRQFHQIGVEAIGSYSVYLDAEVIMLLNDILKRSGVAGCVFHINSLGCDKDKSVIKEKIRQALKPALDELCPDCRRRYDTNTLRILDCKVSSCKKIISGIELNGALCDECAKAFSSLEGILKKAGIGYTVDDKLVRGLDYYTGIVFEVKSKSLGAQDALAAGGRYDNLISDFGGPRAGATGFALGMERIAQIIKDENPSRYCQPEGLKVFIVCLGDKARNMCFGILSDLRKENISCDMDYESRSFKAQMRHANKIKSEFVVIVGDEELEKGECVLKDMKDSSQRHLRFDRLASNLNAVK